MKKPIGSLDPAYTEVHIWGAGVSGLLMAHFLSRAGWKIHLYEKESRPGGKIQSHQISEGVYEEGPNAIYATADIESWLKDLGLEAIAATKKLKRRIWRTKPEKPLHFIEILKLLPRLFYQSPSLAHDISVADFFRPLLGKNIENLLTPALQGIYGVGAEALSVKSIWPQLKSGSYLKVLKQIKGPKARSVSFKNGMKEFIDCLSADFKIHYNQNEFVLRPNTIICTDAFSASEMLLKTHPAWASTLLNIDYIGLSSVVAVAEKTKEMERTFGFLFPRFLGIHSLGVLFNHEIFPNRCGSTFIIAESENPTALVQLDLKRLGWKVEKIFAHSWKRALPLYDNKRYLAINHLNQLAQGQSGLVLFGNYVCGISLRHMITTARQFAEKKGSI